MRMWMIDPTLLCNHHLLGEHHELHMLVGCILKHKNITGYITKGLCDPSQIPSRHEVLVSEMVSRRMNHKSPLPKFDFISFLPNSIDPQVSLRELMRRCKRCEERKYQIFIKENI